MSKRGIEIDIFDASVVDFLSNPSEYISLKEVDDFFVRVLDLKSLETMRRKNSLFYKYIFTNVSNEVFVSNFNRFLDEVNINKSFFELLFRRDRNNCKFLLDVLDIFDKRNKEIYSFANMFIYGFLGFIRRHNGFFKEEYNKELLDKIFSLRNINSDDIYIIAWRIVGLLEKEDILYFVNRMERCSDVSKYTNIIFLLDLCTNKNQSLEIREFAKEFSAAYKLAFFC
jgi:hypothetical protein